ncbi:MAG: HDOD domain-containing protein [Planctomycetaceae bacterium]|jgi:HD-like signal output (HDOD) protein|nr:HDOD domain-containing protein [Planctomycetaceae bacterium]
MTKDSYEQLTEKLQSATLCALPQSAARMIQLSKDPRNGPQEHAVPILADIGLSTQILRFVNSSIFGFRCKITSIPMALSLASVRTIRNFVLWSGLFAMMPNPMCGPFSVRVLFQDSLRRAVFAKHVSLLLEDCDADDTFLCAILQDMSIPILGKIWNQEYKEMLTECRHGVTRLSRIEQERMGWNHAQASAILANQWNLDGHIADTIVHHIDFDFTHLTASEDKKAAVIALSSLLPSVTSHIWREVELFLLGYNRLFNGQVPDLKSLLAVTDERSADLMQFICLGDTVIPLLEHHHNYIESVKPVIDTPETAEASA